MEVIANPLPGARVLQAKKLADTRGCFVKTFHHDLFAAQGAGTEIREEYYSVSHRNVLRGMHFQLPPHDHDKIVFCLKGAVRDVLLDLRAGDGFGRAAMVELTEDNGQILFIPRGIAHGFLSLSDDSMMLYKTSTVHNPAADAGILWNSFGFDWGISDPILSDRDTRHPRLANFHTPFQAGGAR